MIISDNLVISYPNDNNELQNTIWLAKYLNAETPILKNLKLLHYNLL